MQHSKESDHVIHIDNSQYWSVIVMAFQVMGSIKT